MRLSVTRLVPPVSEKHASIVDQDIDLLVVTLLHGSHERVDAGGGRDIQGQSLDRRPGL